MYRVLCTLQVSGTHQASPQQSGNSGLQAAVGLIERIEGLRLGKALRVDVRADERCRRCHREDHRQYGRHLLERGEVVWLGYQALRVIAPLRRQHEICQWARRRQRRLQQRLARRVLCQLEGACRAEGLVVQWHSSDVTWGTPDCVVIQ